MDTKPNITGQMLFWNKGKNKNLLTGKVAVQVFGVLCMQERIANIICDEYVKRTFYGDYCNNLNLRLFSLDHHNEEIPKKFQHNYNSDQLITAPIWRV